MEFIINLWGLISENIRNQILWIVSLAIPAIGVIAINNKLLKYSLGILVFVAPSYLSDYFLCSRNLIDYCPPEIYEIGPMIIGGVFGLLYCLLIEFTIWTIKNLINYLRHD